MLAAAAWFVFITARDYAHNRAVLKKNAEKQILHTDASRVIGDRPDFQGEPGSPYTLVEFGDYQCPPCRATNSRLPSLLARYHGRVRLEFRNLPLVTIHPYAMQAALVAESARLHGKFWPVHDALYQGGVTSFTASDITRTASKYRIPTTGLKTAQHAVEADIEEAKALGLNSTPSFILCCPDRRVIRLQALPQIDQYMQ
jgi:protein-disulfide isomerase